MTLSQTKIYLPDIIGKGYGEFWRCKKRYRVVKGSRGSKKSATTALNIIVRMIQYPLANVLVVRKTYSSLKDSCFSQLKWAMIDKPALRDAYIQERINDKLDAVLATVDATFGRFSDDYIVVFN